MESTGQPHPSWSTPGTNGPCLLWFIHPTEAPPAWRALGWCCLYQPKFHHSTRAHTAMSNEHPGTPQLASTSLSAVLLGHPQCREPWDIQLASTSASAVLPGILLIESPKTTLADAHLRSIRPARAPSTQNKKTQAYTDFSFSCPARVSHVEPRDHSSLHPCQLLLFCQAALCTESPGPALDCAHFSFCYPTKVPSVCRVPGHLTLHLHQHQLSYQGTLSVECLRNTPVCVHFGPSKEYPTTPSPCKQQLQPASESHQTHTVYRG